LGKNHPPGALGLLGCHGFDSWPIHDNSWPCTVLFLAISVDFHGSLNVPIEHHPTIRYMVYNGYYKVMSNIPKMGQTQPLILTSKSRKQRQLMTIDGTCRFNNIIWTCTSCLVADGLLFSKHAGHFKAISAGDVRKKCSGRLLCIEHSYYVNSH
jgi:hypothetical protein